MMRRLIGSVVVSVVLGFVLVSTPLGSSYAQVASGNSSVHANDSDRVLFEQARNALKKSKYAQARSLLERLISSYPDSDYVPRAKLSIADAWYAERAFKRAELEYRDFITFFPNRPEVLQAQRSIDLIQRQGSF
jgi:outer membrane protein assembly factor BamD